MVKKIVSIAFDSKNRYHDEHQDGNRDSEVKPRWSRDKIYKGKRMLIEDSGCILVCEGSGESPL